MRICCLDFETANAARGSACSVGVALLEDGIVVDTAEQLLLPHISCRYFSSFNIAVHGIQPGDVRNAPEFDRVAPWLFEYLQADCVVAHNAAFDIGVLRSICELYNVNCPEFDYFCTCKAARRLWPDLPNHKLNTLAGFIGHSFCHHNAEADAEAAGRVFSAMLSELRVDSLDALAEALAISPGHLSAAGDSPCLCRKKPRQ